MSRPGAPDDRAEPAEAPGSREAPSPAQAPGPADADPAEASGSGEAPGPAEATDPEEAAGPVDVGGSAELAGVAGSAGVAGAAAGEAERAAARRRERAVSGTLAAGLILEGITVLFVPLAIARTGDDGISGTQLTLLLVLAGALFVTAGLQRRRLGPVIASVLQLAVIATGVLVPAMYVLGLLFAGVWAYLLWVRQEVARAAAAHAAGTRAAPR